MELTIYDSTAVTALGGAPLSLPYPGTPRKVALNLYNANASARTITVTMGARTVDFPIASGTAETVLVQQTDVIDVTSSGTGVSGWVATRP